MTCANLIRDLLLCLRDTVSWCYYDVEVFLFRFEKRGKYGERVTTELCDHAPCRNYDRDQVTFIRLKNVTHVEMLRLAFYCGTKFRDYLNIFSYIVYSADEIEFD